MKNWERMIGRSDDPGIIKDRYWREFDVFAENTETACPGSSLVAGLDQEIWKNAVKREAIGKAAGAEGDGKGLTKQFDPDLSKGSPQSHPVGKN
jgi:hypothetical protein